MTLSVGPRLAYEKKARQTKKAGDFPSPALESSNSAVILSDAQPLK